jgi:hypothetical protein
MDRMQAFRLAVAEVGDSSDEQLASYIAKKYGVRIEPKFIPCFRASLLDLERMASRREAARSAAAGPPPEGSTEAA